MNTALQKLRNRFHDCGFHFLDSKWIRILKNVSCVKFAPLHPGSTNVPIVFWNSNLLWLKNSTFSCSLACYKTHKSSESCKPVSNAKNTSEEVGKFLALLFETFSLVPLVPLDLGDDCSDYVPTRLLEQLGKSTNITRIECKYMKVITSQFTGPERSTSVPKPY